MINDDDVVKVDPVWGDEPADHQQRARDIYPAVSGESFLTPVTREEAERQSEDPFTQGVDTAIQAMERYLQQMEKDGKPAYQEVESPGEDKTHKVMIPNFALADVIRSIEFDAPLDVTRDDDIEASWWPREYEGSYELHFAWRQGVWQALTSNVSPKWLPSESERDAAFRDLSLQLKELLHTRAKLRNMRTPIPWWKRLWMRLNRRGALCPNCKGTGRLSRAHGYAEIYCQQCEGGVLDWRIPEGRELVQSKVAPSEADSGVVWYP